MSIMNFPLHKSEHCYDTESATINYIPHEVQIKTVIITASSLFKHVFKYHILYISNAKANQT